MAEILHARVKHTWLTVHVKVFFCALKLSYNITSITDGQTDRRTDRRQPCW